MTDRVLLIHGIWNRGTWLQPLAMKLRQQGFDPALFSYDSILKSPDESLAALHERIEAWGSCHLVGHSLGGLMALELLTRHPTLPVRHVVCLGSPLKGSLTARHLHQHPLLRHSLGKSAGLLTRGFQEWKGTAKVGMVAGTVPHGLGRWVAPLEGASDGTVLLEETRLPGLSDHCEVACGHTELAFSVQAATRAAQFLKEGRF